MAVYGQILQSIEGSCDGIPYIADVAAKAGLQTSQLVLAVASVLVLILLASLGPNAVVNLACFVYPTIAALTAMNSKTPGFAEQWLTYFIIFAFFHCAESLFPALLEEGFYVLLKLFALVWCFIPQSKGARSVYTVAIKPLAAKIAGGVPEAKKQD